MYVVERRSPRFPFIASAQVVETRTEARLQARTSDLSREGCYLDMLNPLPTGTRLKINVTHQNRQLDAVGLVVHSELNVGMGVQFEEIGQRSVIDAWLADLA
jgi:PilZ domain